MENQEGSLGRREDFKSSLEFWRGEIEKAGFTDKVPHFNRLSIRNEVSMGSQEPVIKDLVVDGEVYDVYHSDMGPEKTFSHNLVLHRKSNS